MKLYLVKIKGSFSPAGNDYSEVYVLADDSNSAYYTYKNYLDKQNILFKNEREMESVTLIAETGDFPSCRKLLFLNK